MKHHLPHLNHLQIVLSAPENTLIEVNTLHIHQPHIPHLSDPANDQDVCTPNKLQKEIEFKSFLSDLKQQCESGFVRTAGEVTFRFRVGYRLEDQTEKAPCGIIEDWVKS